MEEENKPSFIKETIDTIVGDDIAFIKRKKKKYIDSEYSFFKKLIIDLEKAYVHNLILTNQLNINLEGFIDNYLVLLDEFIIRYYGSEAAQYIFYYVYERIQVDGSIVPYIENDKEIYFKNPNELWIKILPLVTSNKKK